MKKVPICTRILPEWEREISRLIESTGLNRSEILEDAIALYLKKTRRTKSLSRIEALERRVDAIAALVVKG
ncbi:MAG: ribbon-helix-helix protein, CopG family [Alkalinema sp. RU_4_3]|nr:ribbon-helix-helix protein, CopG family [Alkalinema sp. RU_4_3]NJR70441.1 ribbon-helix-helix protein, CopG family [Synechococcales cyanobacterium CRU_2_2]